MRYITASATAVYRETPAGSAGRRGEGFFVFFFFFILFYLVKMSFVFTVLMSPLLYICICYFSAFSPWEGSKEGSDEKRFLGVFMATVVCACHSPYCLSVIFAVYYPSSPFRSSLIPEKRSLSSSYCLSNARKLKNLCGPFFAVFRMHLGRQTPLEMHFISISYILIR